MQGPDPRCELWGHRDASCSQGPRDGLLAVSLCSDTLTMAGISSLGIRFGSEASGICYGAGERHGDWSDDSQGGAEGSFCRSHDLERRTLSSLTCTCAARLRGYAWRRRWAGGAGV